jgi:hypothetical protein
MKYYAIEPEVAGGFGDHTKIVHTSGKPFEVVHLHYRLEGWLGDELLESTPCFIVSKSLANDLTRAQLTGFSFDAVEVTTSRELSEVIGNSGLPEFLWLKVNGIARQDDFALSSELTLIVSEKALKVLDGRILHAASVVPLSE